MLVTWSELPRLPSHVLYDRLQAILIAAGFDSFVEELCAGHYAVARRRPSLPPDRYFRMRLIGYFEGMTANAAWNGAVPTASRCASSCGLPSARLCRIIPG
jgi:hypothetical protein